MARRVLFPVALDLLPVVASFAGPSKTVWNGLWQQFGYEPVSVSNRSRLQEEVQRLRRNQCSRTAWQASQNTGTASEGATLIKLHPKQAVCEHTRARGYVNSKHLSTMKVSELGRVESFCVMHRHSIHIFSVSVCLQEKKGVAFCILQGCAAGNMFAVCIS